MPDPYESIRKPNSSHRVCQSVYQSGQTTEKGITQGEKGAGLFRIPKTH